MRPRIAFFVSLQLDDIRSALHPPNQSAQCGTRNDYFVFHEATMRRASSMLTPPCFANDSSASSIAASSSGLASTVCP